MRATLIAVGTGMPVFVQFNKAVPERAKPAIERSVEISSTTPAGVTNSLLPS